MFSKLVLASNNPGKLREFSALFAPFNIEVVPQSAFDIPEAEEPHCTFLENALAKARHAARLAGLPALSDDSGLCVGALGGEPGVHSAYYAGKEGDRATRDARNNARLLAALEGGADRRAHYYCVLVLVRHADDPQPIIAEGEWHGEILAAPRGEGGFGYDPLFFVPSMNCSSAELGPADKNCISHRALAVCKLA
ncbi:MAG: RdgB/HAM1 family non-canonical purine NTP pyrophosphatase, partial [Rhodocyclaceae bacterium]|nr:RdgB/HAM1 family non-canonical purine NTP pyrophosphatase [Rhodocyclaceae bacterium]